MRRRASIAGLDFKTNFPKSSGRIGLLKNQSCLDLKYKFRKFLIKLAFIRFEWVLRIRVNDKTFISNRFQSVSGNGFGRRMSIASLGSYKYGRAEDQSQSHTGGGGGGGLVVRHIPIVIEGEQERSECFSLYFVEAGNPESDSS